MIKVNVILNNIIWKKYLKNPHSFIDKKVELLNQKNKLYKKKYSDIFSAFIREIRNKKTK